MPVERVEFELDKMFAELQDFKEKEIFTEKEIKKILENRRNLEYKINKNQVTVQDYQNYIVHEKRIQKLAKVRKQKYSLDRKDIGITLSDYSVIRRIHILYQKCLKKFKGDIEMWVEYLQWSLQVKSTRTLGKNFAKAIQLHPTIPTFWILAAKYEFEHQNSVNAARVLLQRGLRLNPKTKEMWIEYFRLEVLWILKIKERRRVLFPESNVDLVEDNEENVDGDGDHVILDESMDISMDVSKHDALMDSKHDGTMPLAHQEITPAQDNLLEFLIPKTIFNNGIKNITTLEFRKEFLQVLAKLESTDTISLRNIICSSILNDFPSDADAIDVVCKQELVGISVENPVFPSALGKTCEMYTKYNQIQGVTEKFINFLIDLKPKVTIPELSEYINLTLDLTFTTAHESNPSEYLYKSWYDHSQSLKPLGLGLERFPNSQILWLTRIRACTNLQEKLGLFQRATTATASLQIWKEYVKFGCEEGKYVDSKVIYEDAVAAKLEGMDEILEGYMRFVRERYGLHEVRKLVRDSYSVRIRRVLCEMEEQAGDGREVKRGYEWLHNRVPKDTELWIRHCKYLVGQGDFEEAMKVFDRGMRIVDNPDFLQSEYRMLVTQ